MSSLCGGAPPLGTAKTNDIDEPYRILVPYPFTWRTKIGRVECTCTMVEEWYQPWYGITISHTPECAAMQHLKRYPGIENFMDDSDPTVIAQSE